MTAPCPIQSPLDPLAAKFSGDGIIGIVNGQSVTIEKTRQRRVTLFLFDKLDSRPLTEAFQLVLQGKNREISEILIVASTHVYRLFKGRVVPRDDFPDLILNAEVNNIARGFIQVVSNLIRAAVGKPRLLSRDAFYPLLILVVSQVSYPFIKPLVNRFERFSVNQKSISRGTNDGAKVIESEVNSYRSCRLRFYQHIFIHLVNERAIEKSPALFRQYADFLNPFIPNPFGNRNVDRTALSSKLSGRGYQKSPSVFSEILSRSDRDNQRKESILFQVFRKFYSLLIDPLFSRFQQFKKSLESSIDVLQGLLTAIGSEKLVVLVFFDEMIRGLVTQVFPLLKEILSHRVKPHVKEVFRQVTEFFQDPALRIGQLESYRLSQQHREFPLYIYYSSGSYTTCKPDSEGGVSSPVKPDGFNGSPHAAI